MTAFNVVRMKVRPGREEDLIAFWKAEPMPKGARRGTLIRTGQGAFCFIGEWDSMDSIVAARPQMIASLDKTRPWLEDLGGGLGVTDPVSGEVVLARP